MVAMSKYLLSKKRHEEFNTSRFVYRFLFDDMGKFDDPKAEFLKTIQSVVDEILAEDPNIKKIGLVLSSSLLSNGDLHIPFTEVRSDFVFIISNEIYKLQQSDGFSLLLDLPFDVAITTHSPSHGRGKIKQVRSFIDPKIIFDIDLFDGLCLFYSLLAAMEFHGTKQNTKERKKAAVKYKSYPKVKRSNILKKEVEVLIKKLGFVKKHDGYTLTDVSLIQNKLDKLYPGKYRIVVFSLSSFTKPVFKGPKKSEILLPIYYSNNHFAAIKNLSYFTSGKISYNWCEECETTFNRVVRHSNKCVIKCGRCMLYGFGPCEPDGSFVTCQTCNRFFTNKVCMARHIEKNICNIIITCDICGITYSKRLNPNHECNTRFCYVCKSYHEGRDCFISVLPEKEIVDYRIIIFDFETSAEDYVTEKLTEHIVVFVGAYVFCTRCIFNGKWQDEKFTCEICGPKRWYKWSAINGDDCMTQFIKTILYDFNNKYKSCLLAHASSRFDSLFVLRKLFDLNISPKIIKKGNKFYLIRVPKRKNTCELVFKDTYLFMGTSLEKLVTSFDLNVECKMFFPYAFIKKSNFHKELPHLPNKEDYFYKTMKEDKQQLFDIWYEENYNTPFSLGKMLDIYCTSDCNILAHATVAFFKLFYNITKTDPFESQTIAGACMRAYRTHFLPRQSIAIMPENGYGSHENASAFAIKWLLWIEKKHLVVIQHRNTIYGEKYIAGFKVDGYAPETNTAYECLGDIFHGCNICFKNRDTIMPTGRTAEIDYQKTMERIELIKATGVKVVYKFECEIRRELNVNIEMANFFNDQILADHILPRESLFGGRVSPQKLYTEAPPGYSIKYLDVRSLYPSIMLNEYPIGVPEIINIPFSSQDVNWTCSAQIPVKGILQVFIVPPRSLIIPVIPMRYKEMLYFTLCRSCAIYFEKINTRVDYLCKCSDQRKGFIISLTHLELGAGLDRGYRVTKYFNAYHYTEWSSDLFAGYIRRFGKVKLEAEGWPKEIQSEAAKEEYIKTYKEKFGIEIDKENVKKNKQLGTIGKSLITNLWGKFCQNPGKDYVDITSDPLIIDKVMYDETKEVKSLDILNKNLAMVVSKDKNGFLKESKTSSVLIGIFTCSMARLKLFSYLEKIHFTPFSYNIYHDTDSAVFLCRNDIIPLNTGPYLGDLSDEYPDSEILEFCTNGCKQYAMKLNKDGVISYLLKLRGITINADVAKLLHYDKFKQM
uniref:DNA-directed DNA polymerase n=1 Tax=Panagrolaimus sp. ES5 TaxID=591445 RepID=A0AC34EZR4_9BILA